MAKGKAKVAAKPSGKKGDGNIPVYDSNHTRKAGINSVWASMNAAATPQTSTGKKRGRPVGSKNKK